MSAPRWVAAVAAVALLQACLHARTGSVVIAPDATVPVSMSGAVRDGDGRVLQPRDLQVVGHYDETFHAFSLIWSTVRLRPTTDISGSINRAVAAAHGEAVTQLSIVTDGCLGYLILLWWIPVVPSCTRYRIRGNIVRVAAPAPHAAVR